MYDAHISMYGIALHVQCMVYWYEWGYVQNCIP